MATTREPIADNPRGPGAPVAPEGGRPAPIARELIRSLHEKNVRYCHWKSNVRLSRTIAGNEDIDILVDRRDAPLLLAALAENGFKLARNRCATGHPGVFHALGIDEASGTVADMHAYHQVVSGDSLVKNFRLPIEDALLARTHLLDGVRVPPAEAELVLFAVRIALKHVSPVEILKTNRKYRKVSSELAWLRERADSEAAASLCQTWFPAVRPEFFAELLQAIADDRAIGRRILLGIRLGWKLRGLRRLNWLSALVSRYWRLARFVWGKLRKRRDLVPQTGGLIVALVGPKATGKSTIGRELASRLGRHLDVVRIHSGKPPATALSFLPRLFVPLARRLLPGERLSEYEKPERRDQRRFSLFYVVRMTLLAYDRRRLLRRAMRQAAAGAIVISDRYPSQTAGAIDSSCFDNRAVASCGSRLKRWFMERERGLYRDLPAPSLVLRLAAPIETAIERDAHRLKQGGPDADAVRRRWDLEQSADFPGTPVVSLDTGRPLDATVRDALRAVWAAL